MRKSKLIVFAALGAFIGSGLSAADTQAASLTVCNQSAGRLYHVILDPRTGGTFSQTPMSVGIPSGACLTESGMPQRTYSMLLVRGSDCRFDVNVTGDVTWTFDAAMAAECDRVGDELRDMMFGGEGE